MSNSSKIAELKFYANIGTWGVTASSFTDVFESMSAKHSEILIRVHSYGGSVIEGNVMYNSINRSESKVTVQIDGIAASMMALIMLGADEIHIADNGFVMIHSPYSGVGGNAKQHEAEAKLLRNMQNNIAKRIIEKTGKSEEEVNKLFDGTDHWFSAEEAKAYGLVDKVIPATVKNVKNLNAEMVMSLGIEKVYNRYAAQLHQFSHHNKNIDIMKKLIIDLYKLQGVTEDSSDAEVLAALQSHHTALDNKIKELENAQAVIKKQQIDSIISQSEKQLGKSYDDKQKDALEQIGNKAGIEALQTALGISTPQASSTPRVMDVINTTGAKASASNATEDRNSWDWDKWQQEDPRGLEKMQREDADRFEALYSAAYEV